MGSHFPRCDCPMKSRRSSSREAPTQISPAAAGLFFGLVVRVSPSEAPVFLRSAVALRAPYRSLEDRFSLWHKENGSSPTLLRHFPHTQRYINVSVHECIEIVVWNRRVFLLYLSIQVEE